MIQPLRFSVCSLTSSPPVVPARSAIMAFVPATSTVITVPAFIPFSRPAVIVPPVPSTVVITVRTSDISSMWVAFYYVIPGIIAVSDDLLAPYTPVSCISYPVSVKIPVRIPGIYHYFIAVVKIISSVS